MADMVAGRIVSRNIEVTSCRPILPSLEDVYIELVKGEENRTKDTGP